MDGRRRRPLFPSVEEPLGQVLLEAMSCERSVVASRVGGAPEFVTPEIGALVDPLSVASIGEGLQYVTELSFPNKAGRAAAGRA